MSDRINLRCSSCGEMRTPIINSFLLDSSEPCIAAICHNCMRQNLRSRSLEEMPPIKIRDCIAPEFAIIGFPLGFVIMDIGGREPKEEASPGEAE